MRRKQRYPQLRLFPLLASDVPEETGPVSKLYVFTNTEMPGLVKIGKTGVGVEKRRHDLERQTANPGVFVKQLWYSADSIKAHEKRVHEILMRYRVETWKEFFRISVEVAYEKMKAYFGREPDWMAKTLRGRLEGQGLLGKTLD